MKEYWVSAYDEVTGSQFGCSIISDNTDNMFSAFHNTYPHSDIADYGIYEED